MAISGGDGSIILTTKVDNSGLNKGMVSIKNSAKSLMGTVSKLGAAIGVAFSVSALINFGKAAINLASDLQEVQNVVDVAFGEMSYKIEEFAKTAIENFGISELTAKRTASTYMAMAKGMGIVDDVASDMAITMTGLSADLASFYNISQERADVILKSVYTGETETLKQLGIVMTEVNLEQFALSKGINKNIRDMTQQEKTMLRYQFVLEQTKLAQGDFVRTQDSWANQTRILSERWKEMQRIFGEAFMAIGTLVLPAVNNLISGLTEVAERAKYAAQWVYKVFTGKEIQATASAGSGISETAESMGELGDATEKAGKQAKKALAGFDDLQIITSNVQEAAQGTGNELSNINTNVQTTPTTDENAKEINTSNFDLVISKLKIIRDLFMQGFWQGFGNADFSKPLESLKGIGESLSNIAVNVMPNAQNFATSFVTAFGQMIGSLGSIGNTIATNLLGGFNAYLDENSPFITERIGGIFDASSEISTSVGNTWQAFSNIFSAFADENGVSLTGHIISIFGNAFLAIGELATRFGADFIGLIATPISENQEELKLVLDDVLGFFSDVFGTVDGLVRNIGEKFVNLYQDHISPTFEEISEVISEWVKTFTDAYNKNIKPVFDKFAKKFNEVVNQHVKPMVDKMIEYVEKVMEYVREMWDNVLKPIGNWVINVLAKQFSNAFATIGDVFNTAVALISDVVGSIFEVLSGLMDFILGVFTGDWERAWEGLKSIFTGIINGIIGVFEGAINFIIDGLNSIIRNANSLVGTVGDLFGANWSIPEVHRINLPRLAQGTVIPANREFLAVLGDQKQGVNIEAPLQTIVDAFNIALSNNGGYNSGKTEVVLEIDGREFGRAVVEQGNRENRRIGTRLVIA